MKTHLNTLFVTLEGAYLHQDGAAVEVRHNGSTRLRVPLHNLDGIVTLAWDATASAALMGACADAGVTLSFCSPHGKFLAASRGFQSGNILLRRAQYRAADDPASSLQIARHCIAAKIANSRVMIQRRLREAPAAAEGRASLENAQSQLGHRLQSLTRAPDLDVLRGVEGEASSIWFSALPYLFTDPAVGKLLQGRSRRPPLDLVNALLSFVYSLLTHDCRSACEACGLDPQCGFLHRDRPGRASLALDLMEEFRPAIADRLALTLFNRGQVTPSDFETQASGAVMLRKESRKKVLTAWQERKQEVVLHPFLNEKTSIGLFPHLQARLLARHLRGDLDAYPAFLWR